MPSSCRQPIFGAFRDQASDVILTDIPEQRSAKTVANIKAREVNLISSEERIDTTSAAGELAFHVLGAIAKFERRLISLHTKDWSVPARKHGRSLGRPPLQPKTIPALQDLVAARKSVSQAERHFGIGRSTAYKAMRNAMQ